MDPDGGGSTNSVFGLDVNWTPLFPDDSAPEWPLEIHDALEFATSEPQDWAGIHQAGPLEPTHETDIFSLFEVLGESDPFSAYHTLGQETVTQSPSTCEFSFGSPSPPGLAQFSPTTWESPLTPDTPVELCPSITWPETYHTQSTTQLLSPDFFMERETLYGTAGQHVPVASEPQFRNHRTHNRKSSRPKLPAREQRKNELPEVCGHCGKRHQYKAGLRRHIRSRHPGVLAPEIFPCDECDKQYKRSDRLYRHGIAKHGWPPKPPKGRRGPAAGRRQGAAVKDKS